MRILIVKTSSLGDILHTFPAVSDVSKQIEGVRIDWLVEDSFAMIPKWHHAIDQVLTVSMRNWRKFPWLNHLPEVIRSVKQFRGSRYDLIVDAQGLLKSALLTALCKGERVGYSKQAAREPAARYFYHRSVSVDPNQHAVDKTREMFSRILDYKLNPELDYGLRFHHQKSSEDPFLVFIHGTTWRSKQWPIAYWKDLARMAADGGYQILLPWGTEQEQDNARHIADGIAGAKVPPPQSLEQLAEMLTHAKAAVSVDTGPGHLAAAVGTPTVSIYGATDPARTGLRGHSQYHLRVDIECSPCRLRSCRFPQDTGIYPKCYATVSPHQVWNKLSQIV